MHFSIVLGKAKTLNYFYLGKHIGKGNLEIQRSSSSTDNIEEHLWLIHF